MESSASPCITALPAAVSVIAVVAVLAIDGFIPISPAETVSRVLKIGSRMAVVFVTKGMESRVGEMDSIVSVYFGKVIAVTSVEVMLSATGSSDVLRAV